MSILFAGLMPTKSSTFAVLSILPRPYHLCGFIHRGACYGMGILFAGLLKNVRISEVNPQLGNIVIVDTEIKG